MAGPSKGPFRHRGKAAGINRRCVPTGRFAPKIGYRPPPGKVLIVARIGAVRVNSGIGTAV